MVASSAAYILCDPWYGGGGAASHCQLRCYLCQPDCQQTLGDLLLCTTPVSAAGPFCVYKYLSVDEFCCNSAAVMHYTLSHLPLLVLTLCCGHSLYSLFVCNTAEYNVPHLPPWVLSLCCGHSGLGGKTGLASSAAPVLSDPSKSLSTLSSLSLLFCIFQVHPE